MGKQLSMLNSWLGKHGTYMSCVIVILERPSCSLNVAVYMRASIAVGATASSTAAASEARRLIDDFASQSVAGLPSPPLDAPMLEALLSQRGLQVVAVACILGGVVANQIVAVLAGRGKPLHNVVLLDAMASVCASTLAAGPLSSQSTTTPASHSAGAVAVVAPVSRASSAPDDAIVIE
jgi:hypothetical protein